MTLSDYNRLKQQVVLRVGNSDNHSRLINMLKDFYNDDIDSRRRYEQIDTLGKLLKVLEIRDVLSEDNVAPLKEISRRLCDNELLRFIIEYEHSHKPREYINYYGVQQPDSLQIKSSESPVKHLYEHLSPRKIERLDDTLVQEIGTYWRDLARNLKIRESDIDEIDYKHKTLVDKAKEVLAIYKNIWDPQRWFFELCDALEKTRRKDLCRSLQNIMAMNI